MKTSKVRGHDVYFDDSKEEWLYLSDNTSVATNYKERPCGNCGRFSTNEGRDGCLETLIGVKNACCGHGNIEECYIQFLDDECIRGEDAKIILDILKKYRR